MHEPQHFPASQIWAWMQISRIETLLRVGHHYFWNLLSREHGRLFFNWFMGDGSHDFLFCQCFDLSQPGALRARDDTFLCHVSYRVHETTCFQTRNSPDFAGWIYKAGPWSGLAWVRASPLDKSWFCTQGTRLFWKSVVSREQYV